MKRFLEVLGFLLGVHIAGLLITFILRLALFFVGHDMLSMEASCQTFLPIGAFLRGLWFDNVIGCYILIIPLFAVVVSCLIGYSGKWLMKPVLVWLQVQVV